MTTIHSITLAALSSDAPIMLKIIFWILILLWAIGAIGYPTNPNVVRGGNIVILILISILGYYVFGF